MTSNGSSAYRFDTLASSYDAWFQTRLGALVDRRESEFILKMLTPRPGETILEVGSGTGYFLHAIAAKGIRCVGLEPSAGMLGVAVSRLNCDGPLYVRGVGEWLPFREASFDALLCMTTLEFVTDPKTVVAEAVRVVRPGGRLVLGVLNTDSPWARARRRQGGLWANAHFFGPVELRSLLAPFGLVELGYCVHVPPALGWLPDSLLSLVDWLLQRLSRRNGALIGAQVTLGGS